MGGHERCDDHGQSRQHGARASHVVARSVRNSIRNWTSELVAGSGCHIKLNSVLFSRKYYYISHAHERANVNKHTKKRRQ